MHIVRGDRSELRTDPILLRRETSSAVLWLNKCARARELGATKKMRLLERHLAGGVSQAYQRDRHRFGRRHF